MPKSRRKCHVKKGDLVMLTKSITGSEGGNDCSRGYVGKVLKMFPDKDRVIVEGVNLRVRHTRPNQMYPHGGRVQREMSIHVSNVQPLDENGEATRVGRKRIVDPDRGGGRWIRYAKTTNAEIDR